VLEAGFAEIISTLGRRGNFGLILRALAVEQAQRIFVKAYLAVLTALIKYWPIVIFEMLDILWATVGIADTIEIDTDVFKAKPRVDLIEEGNDFCIYGRVAFADGFTAELMVFAVTTGLWSFTTEERDAHVVELDWLGQLEEAVFEVGADYTCCSFRAHSDVGAIALFVGTIIKAVHFFFDDIGAFAYSAAKYSSFFEGWCVDTVIAIEFCYF
jgi:hypothetical protein